MFVYLPFASFRAIWIYSIQGILLVIFAWAVPYMNVGSIALLNKFSPSDHQSKLQGMRSSLGRLAKGKLSWWLVFILMFLPEKAVKSTGVNLDRLDTILNATFAQCSINFHNHHFYFTITFS